MKSVSKQLYSSKNLPLMSFFNHLSVRKFIVSNSMNWIQFYSLLLFTICQNEPTLMRYVSNLS